MLLSIGLNGTSYRFFWPRELTGVALPRTLKPLSLHAHSDLFSGCASGFLSSSHQLCLTEMLSAILRLMRHCFWLSILGSLLTVAQDTVMLY